ncbi:N-acetylneuraminate synthase family protein [Thermodesulfobacteriota bacterium]
MTKTVVLGSNKVGDGNPIYKIADIGLTHGGDIDRTFKLIDEAAKIGFEAIKMQLIDPDSLVGDKCAKYTYQTLNNVPVSETFYDIFKRLDYDLGQWSEIKSEVEAKELDFICTSHTINAFKILEKIDVSVHKICTWSLNHKRLIQFIGNTKKPIIIDTGAINKTEFDTLQEWYFNAGGTDIIVLHDFHTNSPDMMNFNNIPWIKQQYGYPVGYTPQGRDLEFDYMAVGLGVNLLEKRFTTDRSIPQNGHFKSFTASELKTWAQKIGTLEKAKGSYVLTPSTDDLDQSQLYFKCIWTSKEITKGEIITEDDICYRRPIAGKKKIMAQDIDKVSGKTVTTHITADSMLNWDVFV